MKPRSHIRRAIRVLMTSLALSLATVSAAQANSIVYLKSGNVWLSTHGADPTTNQGPAGVRISPDATHQSYWGQTYTSYNDYSCGCVRFRWEAFTRWGASDQFSEPIRPRVRSSTASRPGSKAAP